MQSKEAEFVVNTQFGSVTIEVINPERIDCRSNRNFWHPNHKRDLAFGHSFVKKDGAWVPIRWFEGDIAHITFWHDRHAIVKYSDEMEMQNAIIGAVTEWCYDNPAVILHIAVKQAQEQIVGINSRVEALDYQRGRLNAELLTKTKERMDLEDQIKALEKGSE